MASRNSGVSSIRNVRFDVATKDFHFACFAVTRDALLRATDESIKLRFSYSVLLKRVIVRMDRDGPQRDHLITVQDTNVFPLGCALEK